jgi:hypothetical protein
MDEQEQRDIETLRVLKSAVHVEDPNALEEFNNGKLLFDVTLHGEKLKQFCESTSRDPGLYLEGRQWPFPKSRWLLSKPTTGIFRRQIKVASYPGPERSRATGYRTTTR